MSTPSLEYVRLLEEQPLTVDPDYQEEYDEYPEDYQDELEYPINDVRIADCYLSDPEDAIFVELKPKEKTEEDEQSDDYLLPGEEDEVDPDELHDDFDQQSFEEDEALDYPENYAKDEL